MAFKIILIGAGGHCSACIDVIEVTNDFEIVGIIDVEEKIGQYVLGYPIIGQDKDLVKFARKDVWFLITLGHTGNSTLTKKIFTLLENVNANIATVISKSAVVSKYSKIGRGTIIMNHVNIGPNTKIGYNCIINTNANIDHGTIIGNHNHISTHATINGSCVLEDEVFIGSNTTIFQGITIIKTVIVGAGSVVSKSLTEIGIYYGNPLVKKINYV